MKDKTNMADRERVTFSKLYDFDCQIVSKPIQITFEIT